MPWLGVALCTVSDYVIVSLEKETNRWTAQEKFKFKNICLTPNIIWLNQTHMETMTNNSKESKKMTE